MKRLRSRLDYEIVKTGYLRLPRLASRLRAGAVRLRNPRAHISIGSGSYLGPGFAVEAPRGGTFVCGERCHFRRGVRIQLAGPDSIVTIGDGSYFTYDVLISGSGRIEIGERVGLGQSTLVTDGVLARPGQDRHAIDHGAGTRPMRIESDVQVHSKSTIAGSLGERVIVGANANIEEDMPPFTVVGGVPARVLDYYGPPGREPAGYERPAG